MFPRSEEVAAKKANEDPLAILRVEVEHQLCEVWENFRSVIDENRVLRDRIQALELKR